jgi:signal transduction histidine kinase
MKRVAPHPVSSRWLTTRPIAVQIITILALLATAISLPGRNQGLQLLEWPLLFCGVHLLLVILVPARRLPRWLQLLFLLGQVALAGGVQLFAPTSLLTYVYLAIVLQAIMLLPLWLWIPCALLVYTLWSGLLLIATTSLLAWLQNNLAVAFPATCAIIAAIVYARQQRRDEQVQQMLQQMQQRYDQLASGLRELQQRVTLEERQRLARMITSEVQQALGRTEQSLNVALTAAQSNLQRWQGSVTQTRVAAAQAVDRLRSAITILRRGDLPAPTDRTLLPHTYDEDVVAARVSVVLTWVLPSIFVILALVLTLTQQTFTLNLLVPLLLSLLLLLLLYVVTQFTRHSLLLQAGLVGQTALVLTTSLFAQTLALLLGLLLVLWQTLMRLPLRQAIVYLVLLSTLTIALMSWKSPEALSLESLLLGLVTATVVGSPLLLARRQLDRRKQAELRLALLSSEIEEQTNEMKALAVAAERTRLAREVHDDLGSRLMLISLQLQLAEELAADDAGAALEQLEHSREQLHGTWRGLLAVIDAELPLGEEKLVDLLYSLIAPLGVQARLIVDGDLEGLPPPLATVVYRTVQEGLTNVYRHACPQLVTVHVILICGYVTVTITNDSATTVLPTHRGGQSGGFGLLGLRERAEALGGALEAGPTVEQGWRLRVVLPADTCSPSE